MRICVIQHHLEPGSWQANVSRACGQARNAMGQHHPNLILFPEAFPDYADPRGNVTSEPIDGDTVQRMHDLAREGNCLILFGMLRSTSDGLYNSAILVDDRRVLGVYDKTHLYLNTKRSENNEQALFQPGKKLGLFDSPFGKLGVMICHDGNYPELFRALVLEGAEIICWLMNNGDVKSWAVHQAPWNIVPIVIANPVGPGVRFQSGGHHKTLGSSVAVDGDGTVLAEAGRDDPEVLTVEFDLGKWREIRANGEQMQAIYRVRRPDLYGSLVAMDKER